MKTRMMVVVLAMLLGFGYAGAVFAQGSESGGPGPEVAFQQKMGAARTMQFDGTVLSHDVACHCIVVKTSKGNLTLQDDYVKFDQDYNRAKGLKIGAKVKGTYKTVDYINYALEIHEM